MGGSLKRVPHQLGVCLLVSALVLAKAEAVVRKCFAEAVSSIGAGRAWGWLGALSLLTTEVPNSPTGCTVLLFYLENSGDFVGKLSDVKRLSYEIFSSGF